MNSKDKIIKKITELKKEKNALIIVHNYQPPEIQDIADFTGDSLELSKIAAKTKADIILFCGVYFMAETAKILAPQKTVLVPDKSAICPMAKMLSVNDLIKLKEKNPNVPVMCYVNSTADSKAESDICCTSANSILLTKEIESQDIIFVPDKSLGEHTAKETGKNFILFNGFCPTHHNILLEDLKKAKENHPDALILTHPECTKDVREASDYITSTSGMLRLSKELPQKEFIICTEEGILHRLNKENPNKFFYSPFKENICYNMKKTTLEKVLYSLENLEYPVEVEEIIRTRALKAINKMVSTLA